MIRTDSEDLVESIGEVAPKRNLDNLRQKIQSRVQRAKERAELQEQQRQGADTRTRLSFLREKTLASTRFDEALEEESRGVDEAVKEILQRRRPQRDSEFSQEESITSVDFFTCEWDSSTPVQLSPSTTPIQSPLYPSLVCDTSSSDSEGLFGRLIGSISSLSLWQFLTRTPTVPPPPPPPPPSVEEPQPQPGTSGDVEEPMEPGEIQREDISPSSQEKKISSHDLIPSMGDWGQCVDMPAFYVPSRVRASWESQVFYSPSTHPPVLDEECGVGFWPRDFEDEGIHVRVKPRLTEENRNKIENRLRNEKNIHLFSNEFGFQPFRPAFLRVGEVSADDWNEQLAFFTGNLVGNGVEIFDLNLNLENVYFTHHHLFNPEHVLAAKLTKLCNKMSENAKRNFSSLIDARLNVLYYGIENIISVSKLNDEKKQRLENYVHEIKQLRSQKDDEEANERLVLKKILSTWKMIKETRARENYSSTNIALQINKIETDENEDEKAWKNEIRKELEEEELLHKVEKWLKPKRKKRGTEMSKFDSNVALKKIKAKAMNNKRRPGEPILRPVLTRTAVITQTECCPQEEQRRRHQLEKLKIYIRVLFNGKEVCRTSPKNLTANFDANVEQEFNLKIFQKPENITLEIFEASSWIKGHYEIAHVYLAAPNIRTRKETCQVEDVLFMSTISITHSNNTGIGCGCNVRLGSSEELLTSGHVKCSLWWGTNRDGVILAPELLDESAHTLRARDSVGTAGIADKAHIRKWIHQSYLDPNHPINSAFLPLLQESSEATVGREATHFRLNHLQEEFDFTTDDDINNNPRFRLLQLRDQDIPEFQGLKMVPVNAREIPVDAFNAYTKRQQEEQEGFQSDDIDTQRVKTQKYLEKICDKILKQHANILRKKVLENIVVEEQVPDIRTLSLAVLRITEPRRPLRPIRSESKRIPAQVAGTTNINIIVNVARGFNLPIRRDAERSLNARRRQTGFIVTRSPRESNFDLSQPLVRPFVEISFERNRVKTVTAEGANPTWNQSVHVPLQISANELGQDRLHYINSVLYLNVFDEVRVDILEDEREREVRVHQRIERHWLGVLKIPFATLYLNSRIEGTFQLETPPAFLGYVWNSRASMQVAEEGPLNFDSSFLSLFITLDPGLPLPDALDLTFEGGDYGLHDYADNWSSSIASPCEHRVIKPFAIDFEGKTNFLTRFIHPLNPPQEILDLNLPVARTMTILARFVSLIPCHSNRTVCPGVCDIWTTCEQMLCLRSGSVEEHAILLCNYFLYLNQKVWLAFGSAIPEGPTAYVLTQEGVKFHLWRSTSGQCFSCVDHFAPLLSLDCLVNQHNIWANIQPHRKPSQINFNLSKTNQWKPFFNKNFPNPGLFTIQPQLLTYTSTSDDYAHQLQEKIERSLRDHVMEWRCRHRTPWNRHCNNALRKILSKLEQMRTQLVEDIDPIQEELSDILLTYKVNGFPLDMPYTDMASIREAVYATGVHSFEHPDTEFSLSVYVHRYVNNIFAVWVYVAALLKR